MAPEATQEAPGRRYRCCLLGAALTVCLLTQAAASTLGQDNVCA